ncbi:hypothetical protein KQH81_07900 [Clostridium cadaveris]|uniref:hypothetical protein n=1 Tax=Clostridium cadaveris TaxID=1529 RepID=UPI001E41514F|nr:hypothetical protein [Clostridium cadaveris]UFH66433.1 hypothetical protein KQH81_07900 [Clostridium cadaveris]
MNEEQLREELKRIQNKYHTSCASISRDIGVDTSLINRLINNKLTSALSYNTMLKIKIWIEERRD